MFKLSYFNGKNACCLMILAVIVLFDQKVRAQDGYYWTENYGNKSMLLSGTVNASVNDLGAVFYNPGRLGQIENPAFVISAKVYQWNSIRVEDGINEGIDLKKRSFGGAPSLAAGTFKIPFLKNHKFAYSFLTRNRSKADFFVRVEDQGDLVKPIPGDELFNGKLQLNVDFSEEWIGLTWSPPLGKKFSVGLSSFYSAINKSGLVGLDMKTLDENNQVASLSINRQYGFNTDGLIWKIGFAWDLSPIHLGMTVTTPQVILRGKGSSLTEEFLIGIDTTGDGTNDDFYLFDLQDELDVNIHTPWAIGLGVGIHFKRGIIHLSSEWYDGVSRYAILETSPFEIQSSGSEVRFTLVDEMNPVFNYGVGIELHLSEKASFYTSFATNKSGVTSDIVRFTENKQEANNSTIQSDFNKFGAGFELVTKWADITLGATYSGAKQEFERPINFPDEGDDPIFDSGTKSTLLFRQWRLILGFSFPFVDKMKEDIAGDEK